MTPLVGSRCNMYVDKNTKDEFQMLSKIGSLCRFGFVVSTNKHAQISRFPLRNSHSPVTWAMSRPRLSLADYLQRGIVYSLAGLSVYAVVMSFLVHRDTMKRGRGAWGCLWNVNIVWPHGIFRSASFFIHGIFRVNRPLTNRNDFDRSWPNERRLGYPWINQSRSVNPLIRISARNLSYLPWHAGKHGGNRKISCGASPSYIP